jgi:hypothetical protein
MVRFISEDRRRAGFLQLFLGGILALVAGYFFVEYRKSGTTGLEKSSLNKEKDEKKDDPLNPLFDKKDKDKSKPETVSRDENKWLITIWAGLMALVMAGSGLYTLATTPPSGEETISARKIVVISGGMLGILTALYGVGYLLRQQTNLMAWLDQGEDEKAKGPLIGLAIFFGGLAVLFLTALVARPEERKDSTLRRLVYGSNNIFVGFLVLILLVVSNIFVGITLPGTIDTTEAKFYSLQEESKTLLQSIEEPMHGYFICRTNLRGNLYGDVRSLLNNCAEVNPNFKASYLVPGVDDDEIRALRSRLKIRDAAREGLLVTIGEKEDRQAFLALQPDLFVGGEGDSLNFQGESKLMNELNFLSQTSGKMVIYFTQGNGEIEVEAGPKGRDNTRTINLLTRYLTDRKFEIKPLKYELDKPFEVPADATAVVVFSPTRVISPKMARALHDYALPENPEKKAGKLLLILPPIKALTSERIAETGLELMFNDVGIVPSITRVYSFIDERVNLPPEMVVARGNTRLNEQGISLGRALKRNYVFENTRFFDTQPARNPRYQAIPVVYLDSSFGTWLDPNYSIDAIGILQKFLREENVETQKEFAKAKLLGRRDSDLVVAIGEMSEPPNPNMRTLPPLKPRLVVMGSDSLFTDQSLRQSPEDSLIEANMTLFTGCIDWLRERPAAIGIKPRVHNSFALDPISVSESRLILTPTVWFALGVIGLGVLVWVVRRR